MSHNNDNSFSFLQIYANSNSNFQIFLSSNSLSLFFPSLSSLLEFRKAHNLLVYKTSRKQFECLGQKIEWLVETF